MPNDTLAALRRALAAAIEDGRESDAGELAARIADAEGRRPAPCARCRRAVPSGSLSPAGLCEACYDAQNGPLTAPDFAAALNV